MKRFLVVFLIILLGLPSSAGQLAALYSASNEGHVVGEAAAAPYEDGQSWTLLPDGRWLVTGGEGVPGPLGIAQIWNPKDGSIELLGGLLHPRIGHTGTLLPNGRVLIWGGVGPNGRLMEAAEMYDTVLRRFQEVSLPGLLARAYHSATLLTDGRVLFAGGTAGGAEFPVVQLWDASSGLVQEIATPLERHSHTAVLLGDGSVVFVGGLDQHGRPVNQVDQFISDNTQVDAGDVVGYGDSLYLEASLPGDGQIDVTLATLALRFSRPLSPATFSTQTVSLWGPGGPVETRVVPAENGMLGFVTPTFQLEAGTTYTLTVNGAADQQGLALPPTAITFTTAGDPEDDSRRRSNDRQPVSPTPNQSVGTSSPPLDESARASTSGSDSGTSHSGSGSDETKLRGQVLTPEDQPLAGVKVQIGSRTSETDSTGWFLLSEISHGHSEMIVDGRSAGTPGESYGVFRIGIDAVQDQTSTLPYTIWLPKIDKSNAVIIPSPTTNEVVVTSPLIPGLELRIPPNTVIKDHEGNVVTEVSLTEIPVAKPPFPLPTSFKAPLYFTAQPGAGEINSSGNAGGRLIYPNRKDDPPGTRIKFWHYDPKDYGWYVYGQGTVSADGTQVVPDAGVAIQELTGAMISSTGTPPATAPAPGFCCTDGDPVDLGTGLFVLRETDLVLPGILPVSLARVYRPGDTTARAFGIGTTHPYAMFLWSVNNYQEADLILPDGGRIHYVRISPGTSWDAEYEHTSTPSLFYKSRLKWNGTGWDLSLKDGTVLVFGDFSPLQSIRDRLGNKITLVRNGGENSNIVQINSSSEAWVQFTYDGSNRITQAQDNIGRTVTYTYDGSGRLWKATNPNGGVTEYTYDSAHRMLTIKDPKGIVYLTNEYDANGRVTRQTQADSGTYQFAYTLDGNGKVTQTDVTDPRANVRRVTFNSSGYPLTDTAALGRPEQQVITYERQAGNNLTLSVTDALNRRTSYSYDSLGNTTGVTRAAGTSDALTTTLTYEPTFNRVATVTDPLSHTTTLAYDAKGNLTSVTDPLNNAVTSSYNAAGQPLTVTDPLQKVTQLAYESADLASVTDPLGRVTKRFVDNVGRLASLTDAVGEITRYDYDVLNRPTQVTDAKGGTTTSTYDANSNLLSVTDGRGGVTSYAYDNMDRVITRTDPLLRAESYQYDLAGNVTKVTDRRGKVTRFTYDGLNRKTVAGFGEVVNGETTTYESTATYTYDLANRMTQVVDSIAGTTTFGYDALNRLTSETNPQGSLSYAYDGAGRRTSLTVAGQSAVSYAYDNANRLTGVTQGTSSVSLVYDAGNRRTSQTLPNGILVEYSYDDASRLTGITYKLGQTTLGNLTYEYDSRGGRTNTGGSYARTGLPQALTSATYDAGNQLTQWGATSLSYDADGNLTSDGVNTYTWDARNQLTSVSGGTTASFQYSILGRRISRTLGGQTTQYLYDGDNTVQELIGGTPAANLLTGLGVDEYFSRTDSAGSRSFLSDILGSTVALTDSAGALQTQYTFEPFGTASFSGPSSGNPFQFTGRENDGFGMFYYRGRYYNPTLQRFVSEDPIGLNGGVNLYAYVENSPTNWVDPFGLEKGNPWLDGIQFALDVIGLIPVAGEAVDALNAGIYLARGDCVNAALSLASAIPIVGGGVTAGKILKRLRPVYEAVGDHSVWRPVSGRITHYETFTPSGDPFRPWDSVVRFDGLGPTHTNSLTLERVATPHVHGRAIPGGVRPPKPHEFPPGY